MVECPRDAMQGIKTFIPTAVKIQYLTTLLRQGFDVLDCGSFVNPESIPQMADTAEVIQAISEVDTNTELLVIVANERGALRAVAYPKIKYLGFPLSVVKPFKRETPMLPGRRLSGDWREYKTLQLLRAKKWLLI